MLQYLAALKNMFTVWLNRIAGPVGNSTIVKAVVLQSVHLAHSVE